MERVYRQIYNLLNLSRSRETASREIRSRSSSEIGKHVREKGFFLAAEMRKCKNGQSFERNRSGDNEGTFRNNCDIALERGRQMENEMRKKFASRVAHKTETSVHVLHVRAYHGRHDFRDTKW